MPLPWIIGGLVDSEKKIKRTPIIKNAIKKIEDKYGSSIDVYTNFDTEIKIMKDYQNEILQLKIENLSYQNNEISMLIEEIKNTQKAVK